MAYTPALLVTLVLLMLVGALPARGGGQTAVFASPLFMVLLGVLSLLLLGCSLRRCRPRQGGFLLCHVGPVLILAGALAGFLYAQRTEVAVPVTAAHTLHELPAQGTGAKAVPLPFGLSVTRFAVEFYDPDYHLYQPPGASGDYVLERTLALDGTGNLPVDAGLVVSAAELRDAQGDWVRQRVLPDGRLLQMAQRVARHYEATVRISHESRPARTVLLEVNRPVSEQGWRFYLMSYDQRQQRYVMLSARRDPGRSLVIAGLWAAIVGTAWLCWFPRRAEATAGLAAAAKEAPHGPS